MAIAFPFCLEQYQGDAIVSTGTEVDLRNSEEVAKLLLTAHLSLTKETNKIRPSVR